MLYSNFKWNIIYKNTDCCMCLVTQSCPTLCDPWTVAHQAPLSMGFSRQEYGSGLPCPSPGDLPHPGIEPMSLMFPAFAGRFFPLLPPRKPCSNTVCVTHSVVSDSL